MIDNILGIDTEGGRGDTGHYGFCHRMRHAVMILFFFKGQVKSPILHKHKGWVRVLCSLPFTLYVILGGGLQLWVGWEEGKEESQGGSIPVYYEAFLKTQPAHKLNNEKRFFSSKRVVFFFQLTISPSDLLALILFLIQDCKNIP